MEIIKRLMTGIVQCRSSILMGVANIINGMHFCIKNNLITAYMVL